VVFVCTANTARSHLAAALWRRASRVKAASAGTHPGERIAPGAIAAAARHGLTVPPVAPRLLDLRDGDLVVTVCDRAHEELGDLGWAHWSIPDPVPDGSPQAFDAAYERLAARVTRLAPRLAKAS
jgi:protein-tyrosine-phosphatase